MTRPLFSDKAPFITLLVLPLVAAGLMYLALCLWSAIESGSGGEEGLYVPDLRGYQPRGRPARSTAEVPGPAQPPQAL